MATRCFWFSASNNSFNFAVFEIPIPKFTWTWFTVADISAPTVNPPQSLRTHAPTVPLDTLSLTFPPQVRLSVPLLSFQAARFLSARSQSNSLASLSQPVRRVRQQAEEMLPAVRAVADNLAVDVAEAVEREVVADVPLVE
jgi:hypothetical protein